jgi:hypothetical protein
LEWFIDGCELIAIMGVEMGLQVTCSIAGSMVQKMVPQRPGLSQLFCTAALHRRGITAWVERPGIIREGDEIKLGA